MSNNVPVSPTCFNRLGLFCPYSPRSLVPVWIAILMTATWWLPASAQEPAQLRVNAPIVAVEAVTQDAPEVCDQPAPPSSQGLAAALRWDLYERCRPGEGPVVVTGYKVDYEWDGRRFSMLMAARPAGDTVPLNLQID